MVFFYDDLRQVWIYKLWIHKYGYILYYVYLASQLTRMHVVTFLPLVENFNSSRQQDSIFTLAFSRQKISFLNRKSQNP